MNIESILYEISGKVSGVKSMALAMEGLFMNFNDVKINGEIFDGVSFFETQRELCNQILDLNSKLSHHLGKGIL